MEQAENVAGVESVAAAAGIDERDRIYAAKQFAVFLQRTAPSPPIVMIVVPGQPLRTLRLAEADPSRR